MFIKKGIAYTDYPDEVADKSMDQARQDLENGQYRAAFHAFSRAERNAKEYQRYYAEPGKRVPFSSSWFYDVKGYEIRSLSGWVSQFTLEGYDTLGELRNQRYAAINDFRRFSKGITEISGLVRELPEGQIDLDSFMRFSGFFVSLVTDIANEYMNEFKEALQKETEQGYRHAESYLGKSLEFAGLLGPENQKEFEKKVFKILDSYRDHHFDGPHS